MEGNIFFADKKPLRFEEYLRYDENSRRSSTRRFSRSCREKNRNII